MVPKAFSVCGAPGCEDYVGGLEQLLFMSPIENVLSYVTVCSSQ
jgi:hypothetical protein